MTEMSLTAQIFYQDEFAETLLRRGRDEARTEFLAALIKDRFGPSDDAEALARVLSGWTESAEAVHAILRATSLDALKAAEPPA